MFVISTKQYVQCPFLFILFCLMIAGLVSCSSPRGISQTQLSPDFDESQYINPQDFGYALSIKEIEANPPADSSFTPISVQGGMRQAFGEVVYPVEAQKKNIRGDVIMELYVNAAGELTNVIVMKSPHKLLQKAAIDAAQKWNFNPAMLNGTSVASYIQVPINFRTQVQEVNVNQ